MSRPPANEITIPPMIASTTGQPELERPPRDERREHRHLALREVQVTGAPVDRARGRARSGRRSQPLRCHRTGTGGIGASSSVPQVGLADGVVVGASFGRRRWRRSCRSRARTPGPRWRARGWRSARRSAWRCPLVVDLARAGRTGLRMTSGASPSDGSSSSRSRGRDISARAIASICCSPPLCCPPSASRRSARRGNVVEPPRDVVGEAVARAREYTPSRRFSSP